MGEKWPAGHCERYAGCDDALENCREQVERLRGRMREYREQLKEETRPEELAALKRKIRACQMAVQDLQVQIDYLNPPKVPKHQKTRRQHLDIGAMPFDFFEMRDEVWSDIEGHSWQQVEAGDFVTTGITVEQLQSWLAEGAQLLSRRQRLYIDAYYNRGLSLKLIAQEYGVDRTTVSRVIRKGIAKMRRRVEEKKLISSCADGKGGFDWIKFISQTSVLSDRQRQLMLRIISQKSKTYAELACGLGLNRTTVSRTIARAWRAVQNLGIPGVDPLILARQLGLEVGICCRLCDRGKDEAGLTRYQRELLRCTQAGLSTREIAKQLGISVNAARDMLAALRRKGILNSPESK